MTADRLDLDALAALEAGASKGPWRAKPRLGVIASSEENWVAQAHEDEDAALIVALRNAAPALIAAAREAERLTRWQAEAMTVLGEWREAWNAAGKPGLLGASMASGMLAEVTKVRAERDAALAALARVEALHVWEEFHDDPGVGFCAVCQRTAGRWPCATIRAVAGEGQEAGGK